MSVPVLQLILEKRQVTQLATEAELCAFKINSLNITLGLSTGDAAADYTLAAASL